MNNNNAEIQRAGGQDSAIIDNDLIKCTEFVKSQLKERLETSRLQITSPLGIYRTPTLLRKLNEAVFIPRLVSIGPFHHGNDELQPMENVKYRYLQGCLIRTKKSVTDFVTYILQRKEELKSCYAVTNEPLESFVQMILLDGVFIIELFLRRSNPGLIQESDAKLFQTFDLKTDLFFVLENQLPLFVIEGLYSFLPEKQKVSFLDLASMFLHGESCHHSKINHVVEAKHFLDLLRTSILPPSPSTASSHSLPSTIKAGLIFSQQRLSATVLHGAGVKFKIRESQSFLDIKFNNGVLEMPCFIFDRVSETFIRNLMAYEQCHYKSETYLCGYFYFMDSLINTSKDVDLLVKHGIIINCLGDNDEVATLVNSLSKHIDIYSSQFLYSNLCEDLHKHYKVSWNSWKTTFKRDYLSTPWKVASTIAAIILLFLTLIQTVCSLISLIK